MSLNAIKIGAKNFQRITKFPIFPILPKFPISCANSQLSTLSSLVSFRLQICVFEVLQMAMKIAY